MTIPERGCQLSPSTCSPGPGKWSRQGSCLQRQSKLGHFCALVSPSATLGKTWILPGSSESFGRDLTVHGLFNIVIACVQASKKIINSHVCSGLLHPNYRLVVCLLTWEMVFSPFPLWDRWGQEGNKSTGHNPHPQVPRMSFWSVQMNSYLATALGQWVTVSFPGSVCDVLFPLPHECLFSVLGADVWGGGELLHFSEEHKWRGHGFELLPHGWSFSW